MKVKTSYSVWGYDVEKRGISIEALNTGYRDIELSVGGFRLPNKKSLISLEFDIYGIKFPYTLEEGKSANIFWEQHKLVEALKKEGFSGKVKLKGFYKSAIGEVYEGEPFFYNLERIGD